MASFMLNRLYTITFQITKLLKRFNPAVFGTVVLLVMSLVIWGSNYDAPLFASDLAPATIVAQRIRPDEVWRSVYRMLPDLPLENQYVAKTGKVADDNTLVGRMVRYHIYVKGRPVGYRFDWKLTLADYLDANEFIDESEYPSADTLKQNPLEGDQAAIAQLSLAQRHALVQTLVNLFNPGSARPVPIPKTRPSSPPRPSTRPQPGGADLLKL
ncbi:MAG: hypothetical protein KME16_24280 [Scytolyngbya sp. HA4215-MV1]|jgi:hypothetical protein|nr:hypothetical protein [Scytolyngbya sp. HA4215-MV1]